MDFLKTLPKCLKQEDDSCCFQKQSNFKRYQSDITIKQFSNQSKSFLAIPKCIFIQYHRFDLVPFDIDFDFNYATKFSCQNLFSCTSDEK